MSKKKDSFGQGYACAIATIVSMNGGSNTDTREALENFGFESVKDLRDAGVEEYDIDCLRPIIKEIQERNKRLSKRGSI